MKKVNYNRVQVKFKNGLFIYFDVDNTIFNEYLLDIEKLIEYLPKLPYLDRNIYNNIDKNNIEIIGLFKSDGKFKKIITEFDLIILDRNKKLQKIMNKI